MVAKSSPDLLAGTLAAESPVVSGIFGIIATIATISIEISDPNPGSTIIIVIASDTTVKCPPCNYNRGPVEQDLEAVVKNIFE